MKNILISIGFISVAITLIVISFVVTKEISWNHILYWSLGGLWVHFMDAFKTICGK